MLLLNVLMDNAWLWFQVYIVTRPIHEIATHRFGVALSVFVYFLMYSRVPNTSVGRNKCVGRKICRKLIIM